MEEKVEDHHQELRINLNGVKKVYEIEGEFIY